MMNPLTSKSPVFPDRPMQSGRVYVPAVLEPTEGWLIWDPSEVTLKHPKPGMLIDFTLLWETSDDDQIASYAKKWGVLGLCEHGLPCSHNQYPGGLDERVRPCLPLSSDRPFHSGKEFRFAEPFEIWRRWSRKAKALLDVGAELNRGKLGLPKDWYIIKTDILEPTPIEISDEGLGFTRSAFLDKEFNRRVSEARNELAWELDGWQTLGQVRPRISWSENHWHFSLDAVTSGPNLFGFLALGLTLAIARADLAVCDSCQRSYFPVRRPDSDRRNYCPGCRREKVPQRDAARDYRRRHVGPGRTLRRTN